MSNGAVSAGVLGRKVGLYLDSPRSDADRFIFPGMLGVTLVELDLQDEL